MHPNTFLRTFWRTEIRPEVFVAMSFSDVFQERFKKVIEPAISAVTYGGSRLKANRVDLSKSGDSILTDIIDGIAHSVMVLADVSIAGHDAKTGKSYRNGNVMYEVGLALASRTSSEVLLIRDDKEPFLFDVSTVPHMHINFTDSDARAKLSEEMVARLKEIDHVRDARLSMAVASLTANERAMLVIFSRYGMDRIFFTKESNLVMNDAISRLLDKQLVRSVGVTDGGDGMFRWTALGRVLATNLDAIMPVTKIAAEPKVEAMPSTTDGDVAAE